MLEEETTVGDDFCTEVQIAFQAVKEGHGAGQ